MTASTASQSNSLPAARFPTAASCRTRRDRRRARARLPQGAAFHGNSPSSTTAAAPSIAQIVSGQPATAVVLTPAVFAAARAAKLEPLPYVYICAFIANAASFVLPISNPANLVLFDGAVPDLLQWLARFALPSLSSSYAG